MSERLVPMKNSALIGSAFTLEERIISRTLHCQEFVANMAKNSFRIEIKYLGRNTMKKIHVISAYIFSALLFVLMIFCLYPQISYADTPQDVKLEYDSGAQTLAVTITHKSSFPSFHHIKTVEIKKNSAVISTNNYDTQPGKSPFIYTYKVPAAEGDKLEVTATCSLSGSKTATITVSQTPIQKKTDDDSARVTSPYL
jgi:hypothetical protein